MNLVNSDVDAWSSLLQRGDYIPSGPASLWIFRKLISLSASVSDGRLVSIYIDSLTSLIGRPTVAVGQLSYSRYPNRRFCEGICGPFYSWIISFALGLRGSVLLISW